METKRFRALLLSSSDGRVARIPCDPDDEELLIKALGKVEAATRGKVAIDVEVRRYDR